MSKANQYKQEENIRNQLKEIYTPSKPIVDPKFFSGREKLIEDIKNEIGVSQVFILYGERGVGKTSFYNVLLYDKRVVKYTCTTKDDFLTIFLNILLDLGMNLTEAEQKSLGDLGYEFGVNGFKISANIGEERIRKPIAPEALDQAAILRRLGKIQDKIDAIVFDEVQYLKDPEVKERMRHLVKAFSDNKINIPVFFVGIAESDEDLIPPDSEYSEYKMRHFTTARIPPMHIQEIKDIIIRRDNMFKIHFEPVVVKELSQIANGFPSIAHRLALYSCFTWLAKNAGKLLKNWFLKLPIVGRILRSKGVNIENVGLNIGRQEFVESVVHFLNVFDRNYEQEAKEIRAILMTDPLDKSLNFLSGLTEAGEEGLTFKEITNRFQFSLQDTKNLISKMGRLVKNDNDTEKWSFRFSRLGAIVKAYDYLHQKSPEKISALLGVEVNGVEC